MSEIFPHDWILDKIVNENFLNWYFSGILYINKDFKSLNNYTSSLLIVSIFRQLRKKNEWIH
jgi:hypothetical protein